MRWLVGWLVRRWLDPRRNLDSSSNTQVDVRVDNILQAAVSIPIVFNPASVWTQCYLDLPSHAPSASRERPISVITYSVPLVSNAFPVGSCVWFVGPAAGRTVELVELVPSKVSCRVRQCLAGDEAPAADVGAGGSVLQMAMDSASDVSALCACSIEIRTTTLANTRRHTSIRHASLHAALVS
jgi:hypothetical protein